MRNEAKRRKLIVALLSVLFLLFDILCSDFLVSAEEYWPDNIEVSANAAIVMEEKTGVVLYAKNENETYYPASITKILTTLIAIENSKMDEIVVFSKDAVEKNEGSNSHISRDIGEEMTMEQCLYAVMLESANECAYAVAEHVGGDIGTFIKMMNERAKEMGCTSSHFNNPNGLPDENHYVSAHDMALISCEAYKNELFREIVGTRSYAIPPTNTHNVITPLNNHHAMINNYKTRDYLYDGCLGGKTGYTDAAQYTLVTYAKRNGMTLVCVILSAPREGYYTDTINLFNYCFDNFMLYPLGREDEQFGNGKRDIGALAESVNLVGVSGESEIILPKAASFSNAKYEVIPSNNEDGEVIGEIRYTYAGRYVGKGELLYQNVNEQCFPFSNIAEKDRYLVVDIIVVMAAVLGGILLLSFLFWLRRWSTDELVRRKRMHTEAKMSEFKGRTIIRNNSYKKRHKR